MTPEEELPFAQRAYAVASLGAFKAFGLALVGAVLLYMTVRSPAALFQPNAPLVRQYGLSRMVLATQAIGALVVLAGLAWMRSRMRTAKRFLARIQKLRGQAG